MPINSFPIVHPDFDRPMRAPYQTKYVRKSATKASPKPATCGSAAGKQRPGVLKGASQARKSTYDRSRDLPGLLPLWPAEILDVSLGAQQRIVARLRCALREERRRGLAGHWTYNLARHAALFRAYKNELARLDAATA